MFRSWEHKQGMTIRLRVIVDGEVVLSKDYVREVAARRAYDRALALYGLGERRPRVGGTATLALDFEQIKRDEWRRGEWCPILV